MLLRYVRIRGGGTEFIFKKFCFNIFAYRLRPVHIDTICMKCYQKYLIPFPLGYKTRCVSILAEIVSTDTINITTFSVKNCRLFCSECIQYELLPATSSASTID